MTFIPRPSQAEILRYTGGKLGISAVPGSGKTHTLSALAAVLVEKNLSNQPAITEGGAPLGPEQEILVVTFSNPAVANFAARISRMLTERKLIPGIGYRVRTLHGMASDIVRSRAESVGIDPDFVILDAPTAGLLLNQAVERWMAEDQGQTLLAYCHEKKDPKALTENWFDYVLSIATNVISQAKDYQLTPEIISCKLASVRTGNEFILLEMVTAIYDRYQRLLQAYPALDFADLMFNASRILESDPEFLELLQFQWPFILEDEAQDSSLIQERVLRMLTAGSNNWVRVGDTNQAINETFTTANPKYLREFLQEADHTVDLYDSGRSSVGIQQLANALIRWTNESHPTKACRDALVPPYIRPTPPNDPQRNPEDVPGRIMLDKKKYTSAEEVAVISEKAARHAQAFPRETIAILVPSNLRGVKFVDELKRYQVDVIEVLSTTRNTRYTADQVSKVLSWLSTPGSIKRCQELFCSMYHPAADQDFFLTNEDSKAAIAALSSLGPLENFFYPDEATGFEETVNSWEISENAVLTLFSFRHLLKKWLEARPLRIDQLILLIAQDLFNAPDDLSIANQLGRIALQMLQIEPELSLQTIADRISDAAKNAKLYPGLNRSEAQFDPDLYRGKVVITTFHKAKGLEWDQVYLTSCNNFDFPAGSGYQPKGYSEGLLSQKFFIRDGLDLQAEALEQLRVLFQSDETEVYTEGRGTQSAYDAYVSERLRLFYVGITRAKKGLYLSWNTGNNGKKSMAIAMQALVDFLESESE